MSKYLPTEVMDLRIDDIANNGNRMCLCSEQPTTYNEAISTYMLADETLITGYTDSDYSKATVGGGRVLTIAAQPLIPVDAGGTLTHIAIVDTVNEEIKAITTTTNKILTLGGVASVPAITFTENAPA